MKSADEASSCSRFSIAGTTEASPYAQYDAIAADRGSGFLSPSASPSAATVLASLMRPSSHAAFSRSSGSGDLSLPAQQGPSDLHSPAASTRTKRFVKYSFIEGSFSPSITFL